MPRQTAKQSEPVAEFVTPATDPLITAEHKRQLILAHHSSRTPQSQNHFALLTGVASCVVIVAAGWWFASGSRLLADMSGRDRALTIVQESVQDFQQNSAPAQRRVIDDVRAFTDQMNARRQQFEKLDNKRSLPLVPVSSSTSP